MKYILIGLMCFIICSFSNCVHVNKTKNIGILDSVIMLPKSDYHDYGRSLLILNNGNKIAVNDIDVPLIRDTVWIDEKWLLISGRTYYISEFQTQNY
jgi:hypothetical protein